MGRKQGIIGVGAALGGLVSLMTMYPQVSNVYADTSEARATGASSISVALSATMDLELLPTTSGTLGKQVVDFVVNTKNTTGFRVMLQGENSELRNNHHDEVISSITASTKLANLPTNTWGVYFGATTPNNNSNFVPISTEPTEVAHNDLANASGTYKLAIGVKADTSLPAGMYSNNLIISVVAGAPEVTSLDNATYMQDVTPEICANTKIWESDEDSAYLIDKRDGKTYKVARLKDGNCWMQEDLKLSLSTDVPLVPEDSDIEEEWTPEYSTEFTVTSSPSYTSSASWSLNDKWYYQWYAATANTVTDMYAYNQVATGTICPKGWTLPLDGADYLETDKGFNKLLSAYGATLSSVMQAPLYFNKNGYYANSLNNYPTGGYYWSKVTNKGAKNEAYYLNFYTYLGAAGSHPRWYGMTVRCVAL